MKPFRRNEQANSRIIVLLLAVFALGLALSAVWFSYASRRTAAPPGTADEQPLRLSEGTLAVLRRIQAPVEVRFYALLDRETLPESMLAFAGRADRVVAAFEAAGGGMLKVSRFNSDLDTQSSAAVADGVKAFNVEKGDACFLGVAVTRGEVKESLPRLLPEWETALEADLARTIARVLDGPGKGSQPVVQAAPVSPAVIEEVKQAMPNYAAVSLPEGTRMIRAKALEEFRKIAEEMGAAIKEAEQQLAAAQSGQSSEEQAKAIRRLQELQANQTRKLQDIALRSEEQITALQQLKGGKQ